MKITDFVNRTNTAQFWFYRNGFLYYRVKNTVTSENYYFPIALTDLAGATINKNEKAINLMRWIRKALEAGELVQTHESSSY